MHSVTDRQTDGRQDDANSRSYDRLKSCDVARRLPNASRQYTKSAAVAQIVDLV